MTPQQEAAAAEFNRASVRLKQAPTFREGGPGVESTYAIAYQRMARLGLVQPLRKKYRAR